MSFFVKKLIEQHERIELYVSESDVYRHVKGLNDEREEELKKDGYKIVKVEQLLNPHYLNDVKTVIMSNVHSLTEYEHYYNEVELFKVYEMITLKLACECDKAIKPKKVELATKENLNGR